MVREPEHVSHGRLREPKDGHTGGGEGCSAWAHNLTERRLYYNTSLQNTEDLSQVTSLGK